MLHSSFYIGRTTTNLFLFCFCFVLLFRRTHTDV
jgi:hypothetical protein